MVEKYVGGVGDGWQHEYDVIRFATCDGVVAMEYGGMGGEDVGGVVI